MNALATIEHNGSAAAPEPLVVLIVDDSEVARASLRTFISAQPGLRLAGAVASGVDAIRFLSRETVDLVLADLNMPGMDGLTLARRIRALPQPSRVIITSVQNTPSCHDAAREAGADGFVTKSELGQLLLPLVVRIFARNGRKDCSS